MNILLLRALCYVNNETEVSKNSLSRVKGKNTKTLFHSDCFALQLLPIVWNGSQISKDDKEARFIFLHRWSLITKARLRTKAFVHFDKEAKKKNLKESLCEKLGLMLFLVLKANVNLINC